MEKTLTNFEVKFNEMSALDLFKKYEEIGFIYPAKKALLKPYFNLISQNWEKMLENNHEYLWILTKEEAEKYFASISVWRYNNGGVQAQHLVSSGNPFLSLKTMLAAQAKALNQFLEGDISSSQNWFRPNNRYAYRVFASMYEKLGPSRAALNTFQYLFMRLDKINDASTLNYVVEEVDEIDDEYIKFVQEQYGEVFVRAEELDQSDISISKTRAVYQQMGLDRHRKLLKVRDIRNGYIVGGVIANRAPLGLNFSFLENRAYYILDKELTTYQRAEVSQSIHLSLKSYYDDIEIKSIPIVTDKETSEVLKKQGAEFFKEYMQSIWLGEGFDMWYEHIASFLKRIDRKKA